MKKEKAYTLVELMVAIMLLAAIPIIGILIWVAWHFISKLW
jgi:type II secretory pathway pseudopilin PulG